MNPLPATRISRQCVLLACFILLNFAAPARAGQYGETLDSFADGASSQEWLALTDPADGNSFFKVTAVSLNGSTLSLTFPTVAGRSYSVEYSTNGVVWTFLNSFAGNGGTSIIDIGPITGIPRLFARGRVNTP